MFRKFYQFFRNIDSSLSPQSVSLVQHRSSFAVIKWDREPSSP